MVVQEEERTVTQEAKPALCSWSTEHQGFPSVADVKKNLLSAHGGSHPSPCWRNTQSRHKQPKELPECLLEFPWVPIAFSWMAL